jgi:hypothetical protein
VSKYIIIIVLDIDPRAQCARPSQRTMAKDQYQLHPAADIFRDQLLCKVKDEIEDLRRANERLESSRKIFTNVKLHLRDGHVVSTALTRSIAMYERKWIELDAGESHPRPLSDFGDGDIRAMGQTIGTLPGRDIMVWCSQANGTIVVRFSLSKQCAVQGELRNLSDGDYSRFVDETYSDRDIMEFLRSGVGLQNGMSIMFTPTKFLLVISPMLERTLKFIHSRPSLESTKGDLAYQVTGEGSRHLQVGHESEHTTFFSESEELVLSTIAAVGYTDEILGLLSQNRQLKYDQCGCFKIQDMIGMVEIVHDRFDFKFSLMDGNLHDNRDGQPVWRVFITEKAMTTSTSRLANSLRQMKVFLAGMPLRISLGGEPVNEADGVVIRATSDNGTVIYYRFYLGSYLRLSEYFFNLDVTVDFPLSCVRRILKVLGVHV